MKKQIVNICETAVFVAFICVSAQITIPMPSGVPITLQTFAIALCGFCLGLKKSLSAILVYLLMGGIGLPVFSGFNGGASAFMNKTGGFLFGFVFLAVTCAAASKIRKRIPKILCGMAGMILCHLMGILFFLRITGLDFVPSALAVSLPFLIKDAACVAASALASEKLKRKGL